MSIGFISIDNLSKNIAWMAGKDLFTADPRGPSLGFLCGECANGQENITAKARRTQIEDGRRKKEEGSKRKDYHF